MLLRFVLGLNPYAGYTTDELLSALEVTELRSSPGERSEYSNFGFGLLGWILGREAAMGYASALREFVYGPLGLPGIELGPSGETGSRTATGYRVRQVVGPVRLGLVAEPWALPEAFEGAGAVRSTLEGMVGYLAANMGRGRYPVHAAIRSAQQEHFQVSPHRGIGLAWGAGPPPRHRPDRDLAQRRHGRLPQLSGIHGGWPIRGRGAGERARIGRPPRVEAPAGDRPPRLLRPEHGRRVEPGAAEGWTAEEGRR